VILLKITLLEATSGSATFVGGIRTFTSNGRYSFP
jgi:hypothetical protein